ncbi:threonine/serine dehydratase [Zooshikella harenae]|uniref:Threonine/serine dehydratase n=1 Tax=Zooshikella harenae TaxID=2827238 RepID=A0ABS5ZAK7_9GAMM|nr:threonine/serine dehydratase [Zooshikella harenae]MBU2710778.1 threonine/serine dehydratase [Zooshikella harenae]
MPVTQAMIDSAYKAIQPFIRTTPLDLSIGLSEITGVNIWLKKEHQQYTGSFKLRGALNCISHLSNEQKQLGVITASSGNHGLGVAMAGKITGTKVTVFVPKTTSEIKVEAIKNLGAKLEFVDGDVLTAELTGSSLAKETGSYYISPYNDPLVIAGQSTLGIEIHQQLPSAKAVFMSVGGGGLISGIGSFYKENRIDTEIVGCWPVNAPALLKCIEQGKINDVSEYPTLSDSTAGGIEADSITFPIAQKVIDQYYTVVESEISHAMHKLAAYEREIVEGSAGVALAAILQQAKKYHKKDVVVVLCGNNISFDKWIEVIEPYHFNKKIKINYCVK